MNRTRHIFLIIFFLVAGSHVFSQNYTLINADRTRTYGTRDSVFHFVKTDEVVISGSDTTQYMNKLVDTIPGSCIAIYNKNNILGPQVKTYSDGTYEFFNNNGESIIFKSKAILGESWTMYTYPDGGYITGKINSHSYLTVMPGTEDSLKGVKLNVYNSSGVSMTDSLLNGRTIDFTKNFGLVQTFRFDQFPYDTTFYFLRGLSSPDTGMVELTAQKCFDFLPGYEFHYREYEINGDETDFTQITKYYKYFILSKTQFDNSVHYEAFRAELDYTLNSATGSDTAQFLDTIGFDIDYADYHFLDTLEMKLLQHENFGYSDFILTDSIYSGIAHKNVYDWFDYDPDTKCLSISTEGEFPRQAYGDGLGTLYYIDSTDFYNNYSLQMVYFQKGLYNWGTPIDFEEMGLVDIQDADRQLISVYPNPAVNYLDIQCAPELNSSLFTIFDITGRQMISQPCRSEKTQVDISFLKAGVYILKVQNGALNTDYKFIKN